MRSSGLSVTSVASTVLQPFGPSPAVTPPPPEPAGFIDLTDADAGTLVLPRPWSAATAPVDPDAGTLIVR